MNLGPRAGSLDGYNYRHFYVPDIYDFNDDGPAVPGNPAPDFTLEDLQGQQVSMRDLRGKPVVIEFGSAT